MVSLAEYRDVHRGRTVRRALVLEIATLVWMVAEAVVAIGAGVAARSVALTTFGLDSVIELASASVLAWRLSIEFRGGDGERVAMAERRATRLAGGGLLLLCVYVVATSGVSLATKTHAEGSIIGIAISGAALLVMPLLGISKRRLAQRLNSAALRADAAETIACAYLAATTLVGVALNAAFGWWWADTLAGLLLIVWLLREAREAFEDESDGDYSVSESGEPIAPAPTR